MKNHWLDKLQAEKQPKQMKQILMPGTMTITSNHGHSITLIEDKLPNVISFDDSIPIPSVIYFTSPHPCSVTHPEPVFQKETTTTNSDVVATWTLDV